MSLNYIGSKVKLLPFIERTIKDVAGDDLHEMSFADIFAGTGAVSSHFKPIVKSVLANDIEYYSFLILLSRIGLCEAGSGFLQILEYLDDLPGRDGIISEHYCPDESGEGRMYFTRENGQRIDVIRQEIESLYRHGEGISLDMRHFLLASLLESADKVANVASIYGAYLKKFKKSAIAPLKLKPAMPVSGGAAVVSQRDVKTLIEQISGDILYLDPPYNHRQYGANYHVLNSIAIYDDRIRQDTVTGLRHYEKSPFCQKKKATQAFEDLIAKAQFKYIFLSYNNEGVMTTAQIKCIMSRYGKYDVASKDYQRFKADSNRGHKANGTTEYIHILEKGD